MLVVLPYGTCVDPEIVKLVTIRQEKLQQGTQSMVVWTVVIKTDADDNWLLVDRAETHEDAEKIAVECAKRINIALDAKTIMSSEDVADDDEEEDEDEDDDAGSSDDDDDDDDW